MSDLSELIADSWFPFAGDLTVKPLDAPVIPEPARHGSGGEHFHLWFMPRPLGMLQFRGSMLPKWLDLLPPLPDPEFEEVLQRVAAGMRTTDPSPAGG